MKKLFIFVCTIFLFFNTALFSYAQETEEATSSTEQASNDAQDSYYIYPIPGLVDGSKEQIIEELTKQYYEVSCTTPKRSILSEIGPENLLRPDIATGQILTVESSETIDYSTGRAPLWRNSQSKDDLFASLETYWSYKNVTETDPDQARIKSAPIYSLLTLEEQCDYQLRMLDVINTMCSKLKDPEKCALYQDIPGFEGKYTTKTLYEIIKNNNVTCKDDLYNKTSSNYCKTWEGGVRVHEGYCEKRKVNGTWQNQVCKAGEGWTDPGEADCLQEPVSNVPLYLDRAYRLAFLVVTAEVNDSPNGLFSFLNSKGTALPTHEVRVIAFRLPDFASNKNPENDDYYLDALQLTGKVLQDLRVQSKNKELIQQKIENNKTPNTGGILPINCFIADADEFESPCGGAAVQALVDIINNNGESCQANPQNITYEEVENIGDDISLDYAEDVNNTDNVTDLPTKLKENQQIDQTIEGTDEEGGFNFISRFIPSSTDKSRKYPTISSYLVYPYGTDITTVEETLIGLVHGNEAVIEFRNDPEGHPRYYKLSDLVNEYESGKGDLSIVEPPGMDCADENGYCHIVASTKADNEEDNEPRIPGAWLGRITRDIQQNLHEVGSDINEWIESLKKETNPTEQFLAGGQTEMGDDHKNPATCTYTGGFPVESDDLRTLIAKAADKYDVPVELMSVFLAGEHCRNNNNNGLTNVCLQTDDYLAKGNFLDEGVDFYHPNNSGQDLYFNGCPGGTETYSGMFVLNAFANNWDNLSDSGNICAINDTMYALSKQISTYGVTSKSTPEDMKKVVTHWVLGSPTIVSDDPNVAGNTVSCETAMYIASKHPGGEATEICEVRYGDLSDGLEDGEGNQINCVQKGWLWSIGMYCCAIDHATGQTPGDYCTTDPWVNKIEKVETEGCLLN